MTVNTMDANGAPLSRRALIGGAAALAGSAWLAAPVRAAGHAMLADQQWPAVTGLVERYVGAGKVSGMLAAFGWGDGPLGYVARGHEGFDDKDPVGLESLFRVYSMTKPITGMAAMILVDRGKLGLDQPLADFAPEFAHMQVAIDPAKSLEARPAKSLITIRQLLTHTAGLGYAGITQNKVGYELTRVGAVPARVTHMSLPGLVAAVPTPDPDEFLRRTAAVPLQAEPGTRWLYSMGLDVLGIVIQRASGARSFEAFLDDEILGPVGMKDSWFTLPRRRERHLTTNYGVFAPNPPRPIDRPADSVYLERPPFAYGGSGLVTSPRDYDRFLQMLLGKGRIGGRQVMSAKAVELGMSNLLPPGADLRGTNVEGAGFGAGGRVGLGADEGSFGWSGAAGTVGFVQSRIGLRAGLYTQYMPNFAYPMQKEFMEAAHKDVTAREAK